MLHVIFDGVLERGETIDFCMCNPPFYPSREAFRAENARKLRGLSKGGRASDNGRCGRVGRGGKVSPNAANDEVRDATRRRGPEDVEDADEATVASSDNFGGTDSELWCPGGEVAFVRRIISESKLRRYRSRCLWFSSLVSRRDNLDRIERSLFVSGKRQYDKKNKGGQEGQVQIVKRMAVGAGVKSSTILMWSFLDEGEGMIATWMARHV